MLRIFLTAFLLIASCAQAQIQVWTAPVTTKITPSTAPTHPSQSIQLFAARREFAAFQLNLKSKDALSGVSITPGPLKGPVAIPVDHVTLWREHFIATSAGSFPDPLTPLEKLDLPANSNQPVLVEIQIPADVPGGDYRSTLPIIANSRAIASIDVNLHVYDFALPVTPSLRTAFGNNTELIAAMEHIPGDGKLFQEYCNKYYEILLAHRISPYSIPYSLMASESDAYLADPCMTSFTIPYQEDDAKLLAMCDRLRKTHAFSKGYFYPVDEPSTEEAFKRLDAIATRLKKLVPDYKMVTPYCANPQFKTDKDVYDYLTGRVNIFCYITSIYGYRTDKLDARRAAGDEIWSYVAWTPLTPYANLQIQNSAMQNRILPWQNWKYRTAGLLYWSTNYWSNNDGGTKDPWHDMATVKWASKDVFGDGSLLYPGQPVNYPGPLPSLRLKLLRQGLQDYEYLHLAAAKAGDEAVRKIVDRITPSWAQFTNDSDELEKAKAELAALIEKK